MFHDQQEWVLSIKAKNVYYILLSRKILFSSTLTNLYLLCNVKCIWAGYNLIFISLPVLITLRPTLIIYFYTKCYLLCALLNT